MHEALKQLLENRWIEEVEGALKYPETIFILAYDAVLSAATIVLRAHGVRAKRERHHEMTFRALRELRIPGLSDQARYYDDCRRKRNTLEYDCIADASNAEAKISCGRRFGSRPRHGCGWSERIGSCCSRERRWAVKMRGFFYPFGLRCFVGFHR